MKRCFLSLVFVLLASLAEAVCQIERGEQAIAYASLGSRGVEPYSWQADIHVWTSRQNEKPLAIGFAGFHYILKSPSQGGHIRESVLIPNAPSDEWISYEIPNCKQDPRRFRGHVWLASANGVIVVSGFEEAGLAKTFQQWSKDVPGIFFYYVATSPWDRYEEHRQVLKKAGFPDGILELFGDVEKTKITTVEALFQRFPYRQFILIGSPKGRDPEIYGALARAYPAQIRKIYLKREEESESSPRWKQTFRDVPPEKWQFYQDSKEIVVAK